MAIITGNREKVVTREDSKRVKREREIGRGRISSNEQDSSLLRPIVDPFQFQSSLRNDQ